MATSAIYRIIAWDELKESWEVDMAAYTTYQLLAWTELKQEAMRKMQEKDFGKAEELLLEAYDHAKGIFGDDHGEVGMVLLHLVDVCEKQGKTELANGYREESDHIADLYRQTMD